jgi:hypothetical protein
MCALAFQARSVRFGGYQDGAGSAPSGGESSGPPGAAARGVGGEPPFDAGRHGSGTGASESQ